MHPVLQNIFISFMHPVAVSDAAAVGEAVAVAPPAAAAEPTCKESLQVHDHSHAHQLAEIERLLRLNDTSCEKSLVEIAAEEDDVPLFLRQARRA